MPRPLFIAVPSDDEGGTRAIPNNKSAAALLGRQDAPSAKIGQNPGVGAGTIIFYEMNAEGLVCIVMYRSWAGGGRLAPVLQMIVPEELRSRVAAAHHEGKTAHPSAIRTFQAVSH